MKQATTTSTHQFFHYRPSRPRPRLMMTVSLINRMPLPLLLLLLLVGSTFFLSQNASLAFVIVQPAIAKNSRRAIPRLLLFMSRGSDNDSGSNSQDNNKSNINNNSQRTLSSSSSSSSSARRTPPPSPTAAAAAAANNAEFEFQELRIQLSAMMKNNIAAKNLDPLIRQQLIQYATTVTTKRQQQQSSSSSINSLLPGTKWRLVLSNEATTLSSLPQDAVVYLEFSSDKTKLQYKLQFGKKTFGLKSLQANCSWTYKNGLLTFVYDDITTDLFGFRNVGVGLFGLLKGRVNYIQTAYFDNQYWIERGVGVDGKEFVNVYVKVEDEND